MSRLALFSASLTFVLSLFSFAACGTTGGRPIALGLGAGGMDEASFTTATGWDVDVDEAHLLVGGVYVFAPDGVAVALERLERALVPIALAHGGLDPSAGRAVRGEWLSQAAVDLLSTTPTSLGLGAGTYGPASDATVLLDAPSGPLADPAGPLRGHHAWVSGTARSGSTTIEFEGGMDVPDDGTTRLVEGLVLGETLDDGGEVRLAVSVAHWLDAVHFDRLPDAGPAPRVIAGGTQPYVAWLLGLRSPMAYAVSYAPSGGI